MVQEICCGEVVFRRLTRWMRNRHVRFLPPVGADTLSQGGVPEKRRAAATVRRGTADEASADSPGAEASRSRRTPAVSRTSANTAAMLNSAALCSSSVNAAVAHSARYPARVDSPMSRRTPRKRSADRPRSEPSPWGSANSVRSAICRADGPWGNIHLVHVSSNWLGRPLERTTPQLFTDGSERGGTRAMRQRHRAVDHKNRAGHREGERRARVGDKSPTS